ncbi:pyrroloquinoline quinone biosynthesis peptide chaperone PqqD [Arhodomonas sp. AD133]|uniref:pyrroloquinoline quinone biosynthesis peptide chaperone PqqD n=1 Tax=Arhodomonas sp. AD133 TaxID=3415009 RepID=UPI003EBE6D01
MDKRLDDGSIMRLAPTCRLQWEPERQIYLLLYPAGLVPLSALASEVLRRCDGHRRVGEIATELAHQCPGRHAEADVRDFLRSAREEGWIVPAHGPKRRRDRL